MNPASQLAQEHWNETPLFLPEDQRYSIYPWLYDVAEFKKHSGERILEIGCGTGCDLLQFAKHGAIATGVDITEEHLRLARERVRTLAEVEQADARQLPYENATFDYVYSHGVIHHSDNPRKIVEEIMRVLKPGGRFNIHVYSKWSYFPLTLMLRFGKNWKLYVENSRKPVHIDLYTARRLRRLFPVPLTIEKYEFKAVPWLQHLFGWYLIAKGTKR
jgi:ubiquinone/menaquinone biosynthesis C-methylase UbiE